MICFHSSLSLRPEYNKEAIWSYFSIFSLSAVFLERKKGHFEMWFFKSFYYPRFSFSFSFLSLIDALKINIQIDHIFMVL